MYHALTLASWLYTAVVVAPLAGLAFLLFDNAYKLNYWLRQVGFDIDYERVDRWGQGEASTPYLLALGILGVILVLTIQHRTQRWFGEHGFTGVGPFLRGAIREIASHGFALVVAFAVMHGVAFGTPLGFRIDDSGQLSAFELSPVVLGAAFFLTLFLLNVVRDLVGWSRPAVAGTNIVRGSTLRSVGEVQRAVTQNPKSGPPKETYIWGGLQIPSDMLAQHYAVIGESGSGKTLTIEMLMNSVLPHPRYGLRHRSIVYDPKREMLPVLLGMGIPRDRIMVLQPFDQRSTAWDIAADVTTPAAAKEMATILIPPNEKETQPYFSDAARDLLTAVMTVFQEVAPGNWTLNDVMEAMSRQDRLEAVLSLTADGRDRIDQHLRKVESTGGNIFSTIRTKIANYEIVARLWARAESSISIDAWFHGTGVLLLGCDESHRTVLDAMNRVLFKFASERILSRPEEYPPDETWIFFDEAREAGKLDGLRGLVTNGRTKSAHVVLGFQDLEGFRDVYGPRGADEIVGLCANMAVLRLSNPNTQEWASKYFGEYEYIKTSTGQSYHPEHGTSSSENFTLDKRLAITPQEFRLFPPTTKQNGLTGVYGTPAVGAWRCRILPPFIDANRGTKTKDPGFAPRPATDQARVPWTDADYGRLKLPRKGDDSAPATTSSSLRTMPEPSSTPPAVAPSRPQPRALDKVPDTPTASPGAGAWQSIGPNLDLGGLVLNQDGTFRIGGMMRFGQDSELRNTNFNGIAVEKEAGAGKPLTVRTAKGEELTFRFERGTWYRRAS